MWRHIPPSRAHVSATTTESSTDIRENRGKKHSKEEAALTTSLGWVVAHLVACHKACTAEMWRQYGQLETDADRSGQTMSTCLAKQSWLSDEHVKSSTHRH